MTDTWTTRELPVLISIVNAFEENPNGSVSLDDLRTRTGLATEDLDRAMSKLASAAPPFFEGVEVDQLSYPIMITSVTERALRVTEQWPSPQSLVGELVAALNRAAEEEPDPETKSKLKQAAQTLGGVALQIAIGWASGSIPHP